jgi:hypothetical protein
MTDTLYARPGATTNTSEHVSSLGASSEQNPMQIRSFSGRKTQRVYVEPLAALSIRIGKLLRWPKEWDGYRVAPSRDAAEHAFSWIKSLYEELSTRGERWHTPNVTADEDGDVMFEWWNDATGVGLTIYVSEESATYLIAWGTSMTNDMEDGEATTPENRRELWTRLTS